MSRMKWHLLWRLLLCFVSHGMSCETECKRQKYCDIEGAICCAQYTSDILEKNNPSDVIEAMKTLEEVLENTYVNINTQISEGNVVALLYKPTSLFKGLNISASDNQAGFNQVPNSRVTVRLPREVDEGRSSNIVFSMLKLSDGAVLGASRELYENRLVGLKVRLRKISGLQERITITMNLNSRIIEDRNASCEFFDFSIKKFNKSGCETQVHLDQGSITCRCNHLTYFGILLLPQSSSSDISTKDLEILTYMSLIGCSLSLFTLVISVLLFITNRKMRADLSMKVHVNLAVALILLNLHFLPSQAVAALPHTELCFYVAVAIHYSLLASFGWMAVEGFHLYLLLVKVFNIYIRRYLLKLSLVGWGVPAVIVSLVVIIDVSAYGHVSMDSSNPNSTAICYIVNDTVKTVTTTVVFGLVFLFNLAMFAVTVRHVVSLRFIREHGPKERDRTKRDVCTLLGVTTLLGITWSLIFFSFGALTTPGLYAFCILNSLQGFFIFLWFVLSWRKIGNSAAKSESETQSTNT